MIKNINNFSKCQNMSNQLPFMKNLEFQEPLSDVGESKEKSNILRCQKAIIDSTNTIVSVNFSESIALKKMTQNSKKQSVMQECQRNTKNKILKDKSNISKKNTQIQKSLKISDQGSIGKEKVYKPFWTASSKEQSELLWSPTKTDCVDSELTSFHGCLKNLNAPSWFSNKLQKQKTNTQNSNSRKMSFLLSTILQLKITECEQLKIEEEEKRRPTKRKGRKKKKVNKTKTKKGGVSKKTKQPGPFKARKIKLYPNKQEKHILKCWFGASRWTYNNCLAFVKNNLKECKKIKITKKLLRSKFINQSIWDSNTQLKWLNTVPYDVRDEAMCDLLKNTYSNISKIAKGTVKHFDLKFRKIKNPQSIVIRKRYYRCTGGFYGFIKNIKKSESLQINEVKNDFRISKDAHGDYWICIPKKARLYNKSHVVKYSNNGIDGVISLDPGVRTFLTGYVPYNKQVIHFGNDVCDKIDKNHKEQDILTSKIKKGKGNKTKIVKAIKRKRKELKNMIKDLHFKACNFLCENYKTILLPSFGTQDMVKRTKRKIGRKTARQMTSQSHYSFKQRLIECSKKYKNCNIIIVDESYTSKTCSECGWLHKRLKGEKTFKCGNNDCKSIFERDVNGSKNIFLKNNEYKTNIIKHSNTKQ